MSDSSPKTTTPPPPGSVTPSATGTSISGLTTSTSSTVNQSTSSKGKAFYSSSYADTINFKGANPDFNAVIGTPAENGRMKNAVTYHDFVEISRDKICSSTEKVGHLLLPLFNDMKDPREQDEVKKRPERDINIVDKNDQRDLWLMDVREWRKQKEAVENGMKQAYIMMWGQCTKALQELIQTDKEYETKGVARDPIFLLGTIKKVMTGIKDDRCKMYSYFKQLDMLFHMNMKPDESLTDFKIRVQHQISTIRLFAGGGIFQPEFEVTAGDPYDGDVEEAFLCMLMTYKVNQRTFGERVRIFEQSDEDGVTNPYPRKASKLIDIFQSHMDRQKYGRFHNQFFTATGQVSTGRTEAGGYKGSSFKGCIPADVNIKDIVRGTNGEIWTSKCRSCEKWGHGPKFCPGNSVSNSHLYMSNIVLSQDRKIHNFNPNHHYIDSGANFSSTFDPNILYNIVTTRADNGITAMTNAGTVSFRQHGQLRMLPSVEMYYNPNSAATILALKDVIAVPEAYVYYNSVLHDSFLLIFQSGRIMEFKKAVSGLYYYDLQNYHLHEHKIDDQEFTFLTRNSSFIQSVEENESFHTKRDLAKAKLARYYQKMFGYPSSTNMKRILSRNLVKNASVTALDMDRCIEVYGEDRAILKGKMTRPTPHSHDAMTLIPLPPKLHRARLHLYTDILIVNQLPFLIVVSGRINYVSIVSLASRSANNIIAGLLREIRRYERRGMTVAHIHGDGEYDKNIIIDAVKPATMKIRAPEEHCGVAERGVRTVKDRTRCHVQDLKFRQYPRVLLRGLLERVAEMLNMFPSDHGVSDTMSPSELVDGADKFDCKNNHLLFGTYVQAYTGTDNTQNERCIDAIALRRSNEKNGYYFMSLRTGNRFTSNKWEELPISEDVILRVNELAEKEKRPKMIDQEMIFEYAPGIPVVDYEDINQTNEDQGEIDMPEQNKNNNEDTNEERNEDNNENNDEDREENNNDNVQEENENFNENEINRVRFEEGPDDVLELNVIPNETSSDEESVTENRQESEDSSRVVNQSAENLIDNIEEMTEPLENPHWEEQQMNKTDDLGDTGTDNEDVIDTENDENNKDIDMERPRRNVLTTEEYMKRRFDRFSGMQRGAYKLAAQHLIQKTFDKNIEEEANRAHEDSINYSLMHRCVKTIFAQMSATKGIKKFGERGLSAVIKEFTQLNEGAVPSQNKPVVVPVDPSTLSSDDKRKAMNAVNLIEEKRDGRIKGRTCGDGSKQRMYLKYGDTVASPTVSLEGLITTLVISSLEERHVMSFDVPGAFLQAELPDTKLLLLRLSGEFVDIMCNINPEHRENVVIDKKGNKILYMRVVRALYGCIEAALAWYKLFSETLQSEGFILNPYDKCIANKDLGGGKQCTIAWHVDDCIATCIDQSYLTRLKTLLIDKFGEMKFLTDRTHDFLGMKITMRDDKKVEIDMTKQIEDLIYDFEQENEIELDSKVSSPTTERLFSTQTPQTESDDDNKVMDLDEFKSKQFHSTTAKLLYLMKRARPDLETAVSQLMRRVSCSNINDWNNLLRVLGFLKGTKLDKRLIGATTLTDLYTWIDAAYAVHDENMRSHTGGAISLGVGILHGKSSMQKLNTKSSTEAELVGVSEYIPYNLWLLNFLNHQGYGITNNRVYQDNMSTILLEKNGRNSCTGNSRHIKIRFFFIKDRIDNKEVKVEYCPTHMMLADYFTKPLRGKLFQEQRAYIMGWKPISELIRRIHDHKIKEGVGI